jgi:amino-acid N-acetyltransferase
LGARLVDRVLAEAAAGGLAYVFACALERRARRFFQQMGFTRVRADEVPAAKWFGYDKRRQARLACFKRRIGERRAWPRPSRQPAPAPVSLPSVYSAGE